ncbi:MAG: hypothetical protein COB86_01475, partial [Dehalococcoidia bacterium]
DEFGGAPSYESRSTANIQDAIIGLNFSEFDETLDPRFHEQADVSLIEFRRVPFNLPAFLLRQAIAPSMRKKVHIMAPFS